MIVGMMTAVVGQSAAESGPEFRPTRTALNDIPERYLSLYRNVGARYGLDWAWLAAIGKVETDHGRFADGACATSSAGARGPMQFMPGTWAAYGDGNICDPVDAIPAAARYLKASGAPKDWPRAVFAYNHAGWYVDKVTAQAEEYRGALHAGAVGIDVESATVRAVLMNPRIVLTPGQRADLRRPGMDARVIATLAWIGERHTIVVTSLRADHAPGTNHEVGRAFDVGAVDGEPCAERWGGLPRRSRCGVLAEELAAVEGRMRSTELIWCWDPDGPTIPWSFARADHCDHLHVGWDAG